MSRKKLYPMILIAALVIVAAGFLFNIKPIAVTLGLMKGMIDEWPIWLSAIICAFIFSSYKYYWPIMIVCGFCASIIYQVYFFTPLIHVDFYTVCVRAFLFLCIIFLIDWLRLFFKR